jgi:hypothetical protein
MAKAVAPVRGGTEGKSQLEDPVSDVAEDVTEVKEGRWNPRRWAWVAVAAVVLAAAMLVFLLPSSSEKTHTRASVGAGLQKEQPVSTGVEADTLPKATEKEPIRLILDVRPATATVVLDGKALEQGTREIALPADGGSHQLTFSAVGYAEVMERLVADKDIKMSIYLKPIPNIRKKTKPKRRRTVSSESGPKLKRSPYD